MKKKFFLGLLSFVLFFFCFDKAKAFIGQYAYDVNSVSLSGNHLIINGWAAINSRDADCDNNSECWGIDVDTYKMHNIQPTYVLRFLWTKGDKQADIANPLYTYDVQNSISREGLSYRDSDSDPHDFSAPWFNKCSSYEYNDLDGSSRVTKLCGNKLYINIDYSFNIDFAEINRITEEQMSSARSLYVNLVVSTDGKTKTVFGRSVATLARTVDIPFAIQNSRLTESGVSINKIKQITGGLLDLRSNLTKIEMIATHAGVQPNDKDANGRKLSRYYSTRSSYTVKGATLRTNFWGAKGISVFNYNVDVHRNGRYYYDTGSTHKTIPAFWTKPVTGSPFHFIINRSCELRPQCQENLSNPNLSFQRTLSDGRVEVCPSECCSETTYPAFAAIWNQPKYANTQFYRTCKPPEPTCIDIQACKDLTADCPRTCCTEDSFIPYWDKAANRDTPFYQICRTCVENTDVPVTRALSCDANDVVSTEITKTLKCPVIDNGLCKITCDEKAQTFFEPKKSVLAGMGFDYPVRVLATRTCSTDYYGINDWKVSMDAAAELARTDYNKWQASGSETDRTNYLRDRATMDELNNRVTYCSTGWRASEPYSINPSIYAEIKTSGGTDRADYPRIDTLPNVSLPVDTTRTITVRNCSPDTLDANGIRRCSATVNTDVSYRSWTETSTIDRTYQLPQQCVSKYTGEIDAVGGNGFYPCENKYYSDLHAKSGTYDLTVHVEELGSNILYNPTVDDASRKWQVVDTCSYSVNNLIFPPKDDHPNHDNYGNVGFNFRPISLTNPFPVLGPKQNWQTPIAQIVINDIIRKGYNIYDNSKYTPMYIANLNPTLMQMVRLDNIDNPYGKFDMYTDTNGIDRSNFIKNNPDIFGGGENR